MKKIRNFLKSLEIKKGTWRAKSEVLLELLIYLVSVAVIELNLENLKIFAFAGLLYLIYRRVKELSEFP